MKQMNFLIILLYPPRIYGMLKCKFLNRKQTQFKQNHRIEIQKMAHVSMMKIKQNKYFNTKYSQNYI
ncbi:unnamed protein product [Paramecium primaurelia]|uniref:Uncharacterized protein n=1 Tax=Paramecium primaurelia TaxID=5886 RepID=A0A8S1P9D9_PARPR|nr:unnamed protein product [Paramecium primaurelia]